MMNKQDLQGTFSKIQTPDELLEEVCSLLSEKKVRPNTWKIVSRVAACAAVLAIMLTALLWPAKNGTDENTIISAPGILKVYACELDDVDPAQLAEYALIVGDTSYKSTYSPIVNLACGGSTLSFLTEEEMLEGHEITYDISINYGEIRKSGNKYPLEDKNVTIGNGDTVYWTVDEVIKMISTDYTTEMVKEKTSGVYADVIIKADGNIVGYAVFEMVCTLPEIYFFNSILLRSVFYPKVDGEFQVITDEYVAEQIANTKAA